MSCVTKFLLTLLLIGPCLSSSTYDNTIQQKTVKYENKAGFVERIQQKNTNKPKSDTLEVGDIPDCTDLSEDVRQKVHAYKDDVSLIIRHVMSGEHRNLTYEGLSTFIDKFGSRIVSVRWYGLVTSWTNKWAVGFFYI